MPDKVNLLRVLCCGSIPLGVMLFILLSAEWRKLHDTPPKTETEQQRSAPVRQVKVTLPEPKIVDATPGADRVWSATHQPQYKDPGETRPTRSTRAGR